MRRWFVVGLVLGMLLGGALAASAVAADHVVGGELLLLRRDPGSGALTIVLRGPALPVPAPGSADDPSRAGLLVTLFGRGSGARASFVAPDGPGRPGWNVRALPRVSFSYANPGAAPGSGAIRVAARRGGRGRCAARSRAVGRARTDRARGCDRGAGGDGSDARLRAVRRRIGAPQRAGPLHRAGSGCGRPRRLRRRLARRPLLRREPLLRWLLPGRRGMRRQPPGERLHLRVAEPALR